LKRGNASPEKAVVKKEEKVAQKKPRACKKVIFLASENSRLKRLRTVWLIDTQGLKCG
jgi:hypothetical protein